MSTPRTGSNAGEIGRTHWTRFARCNCNDRRGRAAVTLFAAVAFPACAAAAPRSPAPEDPVARSAADQDMPPMPPMPQGALDRAEANDSQLSLSFGTTYWEGDFGAPTDTEIVAGLFTARYRTNNLRLSATLPLMRIDSDSMVFTGISGTPLVVSSALGTGQHRRDGFGDLTLGASYALPPVSDLGLDVELEGRVKLPTASDSSGLSTGRTDLAAEIEVSKPLAAVTPFASVQYRVFGDPDGWKIKDGFELAAGGIVPLPGRIFAVVSYVYAQETSAQLGDAHQVTAAVSAPLASSRLRLTGLGSVGLSRGAPDYSLGASIGFRF